MKHSHKNTPTSIKPIPKLEPTLKSMMETWSTKVKAKLTITPKPMTAIKPSFKPNKLRGH
ncbi:MAG: hypothetical protein Q8S31_09730 [Alphaproteobacteria bacterium]|nr:hypothetical protein [Alphaproteobacteria bacterium]